MSTPTPGSLCGSTGLTHSASWQEQVTCGQGQEARSADTSKMKYWHALKSSRDLYFLSSLVCKGGESLQATCPVKALTVWHSSRPTCTSHGHFFSCSLVFSFPSEEVGTFTEVASAKRGKLGATVGSPGFSSRLWEGTLQIKAAKRKGIHLFFDLPFGESKRIKPSHTEDLRKASTPENSREPLHCPSLGSCLLPCQLRQPSNCSPLLS